MMPTLAGSSVVPAKVTNVIRPINARPVPDLFVLHTLNLFFPDSLDVKFRQMHVS